MTSRVCDHRSVAVIIMDPQQERYLIFDRATPPWGATPPAGHVDDHGSWVDAARAEVLEEVGLTVTSMVGVTGGWRDNPCRRDPGPSAYVDWPAAPGHEWRVFAAVVADPGALSPSDRETRHVRWADRAELQQMANRTVAYADGRLSAEAFEADPGLEPVMVQWFCEAGLISVMPADLVQIGRLFAPLPRMHFD